MTREDLKNYRYNQQWVEEQMNKYEEMRERCYKLSQSLDGMPKAQNKANYALENLIDKFDELIEIIKEDQRKQIEIIKQLHKLEPLYRDVLYYRYIDNLGLEEISTRINYDYYNTCKFHGIALNKFDELNKK